MIEVTLLGTNALLPTPERALTSALLKCNGRGILFDCGEGTQTAARKAGVSLMKTDVVALTHYHGDHIFGLPGLMQSMNCMGRTEPLYITGPDGLEENMKPILQLTGETAYSIHMIQQKSRVRLRDLSDQWPRDAKIETFDTDHRVPSCGYLFELERPAKFLPERAKALSVPVALWNKLRNGECVCVNDMIIKPEQVLGEPRQGIKVAFTGDTMANDKIAAAVTNADLLICEATYALNEQAQLANERGHMNYAQAGELAHRAQVKRLCLTHFSQAIKEPDDHIENAARVFANTVCGKDGMKFDLEFAEA